MTTSATSGRTRSAATIGTFDGVHVGHQLLVSTTRKIADERGLRDVVVTFDRHPFATVRPDATPKLLSTQEQKIELLKALGADDVVVLEFDLARSHQEPESFIEDFLVGGLGVAAVVVGAGFRFGHRARGDAAMLEQMGDKLGFSVVTLELVGDETGGVVSSSHIRDLVAHGRLDEAAAMLGRPFEVRGKLADDREPRVVVPRELLLPSPGRYAAEFVAVDGSLDAVATITTSASADDAVVGVDLPRGTKQLLAGPVALRFLERLGDESAK
ncbi:MAG: adenylyltransferase/cytidyltransferase family protein [Acidimicrobiales bacterium]